MGIHRGVPKNAPAKQCINHGEQNPYSIYPDSFCGKTFIPVQKKPEWKRTAADDDEESGKMQCLIHSGYLRVNKITKEKRWSCCGEDGEEAPPCSEGTHKMAEWPEEEAKLYFYNKPIVTPSGITKDQEF
jgi:hypothetical protein